MISDMGRAEGPREGYALLEEMRAQGDRTPFFLHAGSDSPKHQREARERGTRGSTNRPDVLFEMVTRAVPPTAAAPARQGSAFAGGDLAT